MCLGIDVSGSEWRCILGIYFFGRSILTTCSLKVSVSWRRDVAFQYRVVGILRSVRFDLSRREFSRREFSLVSVVSSVVMNSVVVNSVASLLEPLGASREPPGGSRGPLRRSGEPPGGSWLPNLNLHRTLPVQVQVRLFIIAASIRTQ